VELEIPWWKRPRARGLGVDYVEATRIHNLIIDIWHDQTKDATFRRKNLQTLPPRASYGSDDGSLGPTYRHAGNNSCIYMGRNFLVFWNVSRPSPQGHGNRSQP